MTKRILFIHQGALGDLVLNFPALVSLKHERKSSVALLCSSDLGKIAHELNVVDAHFSLESARFCSLFCDEMTPFVKAFISDYDTIILMSFSDAIEHHLRQNHDGEVHKINPRPPVDEETHVALYMMKQMKAKGLLTERNLTSRVYTCPKWQLAVAACDTRKLKIQNRKSKIIIHPGTGSPRKRWPVENFVQVATIIRGMNFGEVIFVVGPAEPGLAPFIRDRSKGSFRVHEVYDLSYLMALVQQATCFVGNDSGVAHLAAFMGIPTVAIFGPSSPKRWSPVGRATKVLRGAPDCASCFETDAVNCKDPQCLDGVSVYMVLDAVRELVSSDGACDGRSRNDSIAG